MGTQHTVFARDGFEVCLNEGSNEFHIMLRASDEADTRQVCAWGVDGGPAVRTAAAYGNPRLATDDLVAMAVQMIRVASVWVWDERALLDAAALMVMELAEAAPRMDPIEDEED